jgi:hypothetical protein
MYSNSSSTEALEQLLKKNERDINTNSSSKTTTSNKELSSFCSITRTINNIFFIGNEEYYHVELTCNDGTEYGIQAYGEEAKALYTKVNSYSLLGYPVSKEKELEKIDKKEENYENLVTVRKAIDYVKDYTFDKNNNGCLLIFKKIKDVCISKKKIMTN